MQVTLTDNRYTMISVRRIPKEKRYDAVIQIHLVGAPSQLDTFDPKPGSTSNVYPTIDLGFRDVDNKVVRVTNFLRQIAAAVGDGKGDVRMASLRGVHSALFCALCHLNSHANLDDYIQVRGGRGFERGRGRSSGGGG